MKVLLPHPPSPSPHGEGAVQKNKARQLVLPSRSIGAVYHR